MLKNDIKNYLQYTIYETLSIYSQWNIIHKSLVERNYFWLEQLNIRAKYVIFSDKYIRFIRKNLKKNGWVFGKNTVTFWHNFAYTVNSFVFIKYDNYG